ncbi:MAG: NAD(P)-binding domain-containing protein [Anaerolineae bacterium]|jgi:3-hydroxyisobutyrate dehydrogenase-like beta-hydroxyacid dehydrogenase
MTDISAIGLGDMGSALARTLLEDGYSVTVWNRTAEKSEPLTAAGAILASSPEEAIAASPATITCITSHDTTIQLLGDIEASLKDKTIIELSTGGITGAETLARLLSEKGADWLIGMINAYPSSVGKDDTILLTVGRKDVWERWESVIKTLGGGSARVGDQPGMLPALFAALFTTRQGFMFGMIYGGLVSQKAGIPLETFARHVPVSMGWLPSYHQYFSDTVADGRFESPEASLATYVAALDDALSTFETLGASSELPRLFSELAHRGLDAGLSEKALTALVELLGED